MELFNSLIGFIVLGILVTVHEYGHYWVARKCGVKVIRFSVGFGKPIWSRVNAEGTEFVIAWIPLGGYVKMLDARETTVQDNQRNQAFNFKSPRQKIAIALAGPIANFIFAVFAFTIIYMVGVQGLRPIVDSPTDSQTAGVDIRAGDLITSVDGHSIANFQDFLFALANRVGDTGTIELTVERDRLSLQRSVPIERWLSGEQSPDVIGDFGSFPLQPQYPPWLVLLLMVVLLK